MLYSSYDGLRMFVFVNMKAADEMLLCPACCSAFQRLLILCSFCKQGVFLVLWNVNLLNAIPVILYG